MPEAAAGEVEGDQVAVFLGSRKRSCRKDWPVLLPEWQHVPGRDERFEHAWKGGIPWWWTDGAVVIALDNIASLGLADGDRRQTSGTQRSMLADTPARRGSRAKDSLQGKDGGLAACYAAAASGISVTGERAGKPTLRLIVPEVAPTTPPDGDARRLIGK